MRSSARPIKHVAARATASAVISWRAPGVFSARRSSPEALDVDLAAVSTMASIPAPARPRESTGLYARRRPSEIHLPGGRRVLVALPEDARARLLQRPAASPPAPVEVVEHGSAEHSSLLRESQQHHESRRDQFCARYGLTRDVLEAEWDSVGRQLASVAAQLDSLVDHSAALKENFTKFGYDARLRAYGGDGAEHDGEAGRWRKSPSSTRPSHPSPSQTEEGESEGATATDDWRDGREHSETVELFKVPIVKQYFHRGLLWRSSRHSKVMPFELFFDLLFVGIIAVNGDHVSEDPTGRELIRFVVTFLMSWKIWADVTQLVDWFETGDVLSQFALLFLFSCLLGLTTNIISTFSEEHTDNTYVQLCGYYMTARLFMTIWAAVAAYLVPLVRGVMITLCIHYLLGLALWIGSTQVAYPASLGLIFTALLFDICGSELYVGLHGLTRTDPSTWRAVRALQRVYEFYPAINIEHKVERTNAFVCLVLGYGVVGVLYQNQGYGLNAFLGKAILGLAQGYIFNWLYFDIDNAQLHMHAIRRHAWTMFSWQYAHIAFTMSYIISSAALSKLVVAADNPNAFSSSLTESYAAKSEAEVPLSLRLFYCVGLGIALASMLGINLSHKHKKDPLMTCRIPYRFRCVNRGLVCIVLCCLPATGARLHSLQLVGLVTGLSAWTLAVELVGKSYRQVGLFDAGGKCRYTARCSTRELDRAIKSNGTVKARGSDTQKETSRAR